MTNNEIIAALECCQMPIQMCKYCPMPKEIQDDCKCMETLSRNALYLINRQKAEIERSFDIIARQSDVVTEQKVEIERLHAEIDKQYEQAEADSLGNISDGGTSCHWCMDEHRKMAIKEFAEGLTKKIFPIGYLCDGNYSVNAKTVKTVIDNLVKEMTEEKK